MHYCAPAPPWSTYDQYYTALIYVNSDDIGLITMVDDHPRAPQCGNASPPRCLLAAIPAIGCGECWAPRGKRANCAEFTHLWTRLRLMAPLYGGIVSFAASRAPTCQRVLNCVGPRSLGSTHDFVMRAAVRRPIDLAKVKAATTKQASINQISGAAALIEWPFFGHAVSVAERREPGGER